MRKPILFLILTAGVFIPAAVAQEIVIEPTNGRPQTANHGSRHPAMESSPGQAGKLAAKSLSSSKAQPGDISRTQARKDSTSRAAAKPKLRQPVALAAPVAVNDASAGGATAPKHAIDRPEWAMTDNRDAHGLQVEIADALARDPRLARSSIQVKVDDGTVILEGYAAGGEERVQAQRLAQSYAWNRKLVDRIEVAPASSGHK